MSKQPPPTSVPPDAATAELSPADWASATPGMQRFVLKLVAEVAALTARVAELEEKLRTNSTNSSLPPSKDGPAGMAARPKAPKALSARKRGGQPGHKGKTRKLLPVEEVDRVEKLLPPPCTCGGCVRIDHARPDRYQVWEIPAMRPEVTEYQVYSGRCSTCGEWGEAELPAEARGGMLGPRAAAVIATLTGKFRLSKRSVEEILRDMFGVDVCVGTISNVEGRVSEALEAPHAEALAVVPEQAVVHMDETGWREDKKRAWLWTAVTAAVTVFVIRASRGAKVAKEVLGETYANVLVTDRWSGYNWVDMALRQLCWAHLIRDFKKIAERGGDSEELGTALRELANEVFHLWHRFRRGEFDRDELSLQMNPLREGVRVLLEAGRESTHAKTRGTCVELVKVEPALWTFVRVEGVEPTNNVSERSIRPAVIWRKTSFGTDTARGSRYVERVLTVVATCRHQGRDVIEYLRSAILASLSGQPAPSLILANDPAVALAA